MLTEDGLAALRATGVRVQSEMQHGEGEADEGEYLWEGDPE